MLRAKKLGEVKFRVAEYAIKSFGVRPDTDPIRTRRDPLNAIRKNKRLGELLSELHRDEELSGKARDAAAQADPQAKGWDG